MRPQQLKSSMLMEWSGCDKISQRCQSRAPREACPIDWIKCELIERVPGKVSGRPVVRGTLILPDAIVGSYELGETSEELRDGFPTLPLAHIKRLIEFAYEQRRHLTP